MGEERIKSDQELNAEQEPLSSEELEEIAGGTLHEESGLKNSEQQGKAG
jgi:hypothetical protein